MGLKKIINRRNVEFISKFYPSKLTTVIELWIDDAFIGSYKNLALAEIEAQQVCEGRSKENEVERSIEKQ